MVLLTVIKLDSLTMKTCCRDRAIIAWTIIIRRAPLSSEVPFSPVQTGWWYFAIGLYIAGLC